MNDNLSHVVAKSADGELRRLFKELSDPIQYEAVQALRTSELCVTDVAEHLQVSVAVASHRLRSLAQHGYATKVKRGRYVYYSLHPQLCSLLTHCLMHYHSE